MVEWIERLRVDREVRGSNLGADFRIFSTSFQNFADTQEAFTTYSEEEDTNPGLSIRMVYPSKNMGVLVVVMLEK